MLLLSLFAGFYYVGGTKSRSEAHSLALELQVTQESVLQYCVILDQQNLVISHLDSALISSRIEISDYRELYQGAIKREAKLTTELKNLRESMLPIK